MNLSTAIFVSLISSSISCSIFPSLNCSCFQSNNDLNSNLTRQTYSHLYCQGNVLTEQTFQYPYGFDFQYQNHFRTISIEIHNDNQLEIQTNHFAPLAMLFSKTNFDVQIDVYLRFIGFQQITFNEKSLTSSIFQRKHQKTHLYIYLIPTRQNLSHDEYSSNVDKQFRFVSNCFSGLIVSQLSFYIHTFRDHFPSEYTFEDIFNNTNIGELHFHGSIIRPGGHNYLGLIRSLKIHRHVDTIDSHTFPYYSQVNSYIIHSIEAHSMNLSSFLSFRNLRGLEIIRPRFEVSINQFLPTLDSLTLNIENLTKTTLLIARHIFNLKLGSQIRSIDSNIYSFFSRLHHLDLSDIDLSQMTSESRCHLIKYLSENVQSKFPIIYPQMKSFNECHCAQIYLQHLQLIETNQTICSSLCYLNDCPIISEFFKEKYLLNNQTNSEQEIRFNRPIEIFSEPIDSEIIEFLINQTSEQEKNQTQRRPISIDLENVSTLENIQEYDEMISFSTPDLFELTTEESFEQKQETFSWFAFSIGIALVLVIFFIFLILFLIIIRCRKEHHFKPVPVYV